MLRNPGVATAWPERVVQLLEAHAGSSAARLRAANNGWKVALPAPAPAVHCDVGCPSWSSRAGFWVGLCFGWPGGAAPPEGARQKGFECVEVVEPWWCMSSLLLLLGSPVDAAARAVLRAAKKLVRPDLAPFADPVAKDQYDVLRGFSLGDPHVAMTATSGREGRLLTALAAISRWQLPTSEPEILRKAAIFYPRRFFGVDAQYDNHCLLKTYGLNHFQNDDAFVRAAVAAEPQIYAKVSHRLRARRDIALAAARSDGVYVTKYAPPEILADKDIMLAAVSSITPEAMAYAPEKYKADRDVVLTAVRRHGAALEHAAPALKADRDVVLAAVRREGAALKYAAPVLKADRDVVLTAVRREGTALKYAAPVLKADRDVVLTAVLQDGAALKYAAPVLKADRDVVLAAVADSPWALGQAALALRSDENMMRAAVAAPRL